MFKIQNLIKLQQDLTKAKDGYLNYHQDNYLNWNDDENKMAEETLGILFLHEQKINEISTFYNEHTLDELPVGFITSNDLIDYFNYLSIIVDALLKQIPSQYL